MITGKITTNREAVISLEVVSYDQRKVSVEAVIDTGFNGYLTLPSDLINQPGFQSAGSRGAALGNGRVVVIGVYLARVLWLGEEREVLALKIDSGSLVGMSLLHGNRVLLEVVDDGSVIIEPLPQP